MDHGGRRADGWWLVQSAGATHVCWLIVRLRMCCVLRAVRARLPGAGRVSRAVCVCEYRAECAAAPCPPVPCPVPSSLRTHQYRYLLTTRHSTLTHPNVEGCRGGSARVELSPGARAVLVYRYSFHYSLWPTNASGTSALHSTLPIVGIR